MTAPPLTTLDNWENEGGAARSVPSSPPRQPRRPALPVRRSAKAPEDTASGCRARAAADLAAAAVTDTANGRLKFERSALVWGKRGDLMERFEASRLARRRGREA